MFAWVESRFELKYSLFLYSKTTNHLKNRSLPRKSLSEDQPLDWLIECVWLNAIEWMRWSDWLIDWLIGTAWLLQGGARCAGSKLEEAAPRWYPRENFGGTFFRTSVHPATLHTQRGDMLRYLWSIYYVLQLVWPPIIFRPEGLKSCGNPKTRGHARKTVKKNRRRAWKTVNHFLWWWGWWWWNAWEEKRAI